MSLKVLHYHNYFRCHILVKGIKKNNFSDPVLPDITISLLDERRDGLVVCKVQASPLSTQDYSAINVTSAFDPSLASTYGYPQQTKLNRDTIEVS